ncbi:CidA/LrgA family protein [Acuticoccus sp. MNP-M23]|uniref:CidA/LrgA family protein n=1 Tax=Acuticoccus sp. MNP-M23 TaxID=3072793 RepID=UPI0028157251|nr:CidA/LrgA family protein [Acuticoccus sp. MNP-M23]WMS40870.1 CidA/LrgA family protein [Acuticoccus sp. MNP-M23]
MASPTERHSHMINALVVLLGFQLGGEVLVRLLDLPIPGPVLGGGALAAALLIRGRIGTEVAAVSHTILRNLSLLFVPAAVGVIEYRDIFTQYGLPLVSALVISSITALAVSALVFRWVAGSR